MRSLYLGSFSVALVSLLSIGCGDSGSGGGGAGGTPSTGGNDTGGNDTGGGGSSGECAVITDIPDFRASGGLFYGQPAPALGAAGDDEVDLYLLEDSAGDNTISMPTNTVDCDTQICVVALEDLDAEGLASVFYIGTGGTVDVGAGIVDSYYITGSFTDLTFVEALIDEETGDITAVAGGKCLSLPSFSFDLQPPVAGWTCPPSYYDETSQGTEVGCDCDCGAVDPDCSTPDVMLFGCADGQTCSATGECEGLPTGWTCAEDQYDGGPGNGCDCCGIYDPDCDLDPAEPVEGCVGAEECNSNGLCVPVAWTCDPDYYGDELDCDCEETPGCGVQDIDCNDPLLEQYGCDETTDTCVGGLCTP